MSTLSTGAVPQSSNSETPASDDDNKTRRPATSTTSSWRRGPIEVVSFTFNKGPPLALRPCFFRHQTAAAPPIKAMKNATAPHGVVDAESLDVRPEVSPAGRLDVDDGNAGRAVFAASFTSLVSAITRSAITASATASAMTASAMTASEGAAASAVGASSRPRATSCANDGDDGDDIGVFVGIRFAAFVAVVFAAEGAWSAKAAVLHRAMTTTRA